MTPVEPMQRGWCPGVLRPMETGDGLIVRLKLSGGIVDVATTKRIAEWARCWGNGDIALSNRANLQLRGISPTRLADLAETLSRFGLLDGSESGEAVRNVMSSPLAGLDPDAALDIRPVVKALEQRLSSDASLHGLPGKFGFSIDDGGSLGLGNDLADVGFVAARLGGGPGFEGRGPSFHIRLSGAAKMCFGPCRPTDVADTAAAIAGVFLRAMPRTGVRRMRDLVAAIGAEAIAEEAGLARPQTASGSRVVRGNQVVRGGQMVDEKRTFRGKRTGRGDRAVSLDDVLGLQPLGSGAFVGIGLPFGATTAEDLAAFAGTAGAHGAAELRLTPWRAILVPVQSVAAGHSLAAALMRHAFILDPGDPRLLIAACPGAPACSRASTPARADAARLAADLNGVPGGTIPSGAVPAGVMPSGAVAGGAIPGGVMPSGAVAGGAIPDGIIHVSGCAKGCAHPRAAAVTLVARNGRYDLVRDGTASDPPVMRGLTLDQVRLHIRGGAA